jgi:hypothetical protein
MWRLTLMGWYGPRRYILVGGKMRLSTDPRIRLEEFKRQRDRILLYGSPDDLKVFLKERGLPVPRNRAVLEMTWHKSITASMNLPKEYRQRSKNWLTFRGYHSLDDGDLV